MTPVNHSLALPVILPAEIIDHTLSFADLKTLAIAARVCQQWRSLVRVPLSDYKFAEIELRRSIFCKMTQITGTQEDVDFLNNILNFNVSREKIPTKNGSLLHKIQGVFNFLFHQKGLYTLLNNAIEHKAYFSKVFFALDFPSTKQPRHLFQFALESFEPPEGLCYLPSANFKEQLEMLPQMHHKTYLAITRGICEDPEAVAILKDVIPRCPGIKDFLFSSMYTNEDVFDKNISPISNLLGMFIQLDRFMIGTQNFHLHDEDLCSIALLIKQRKLYALLITDENNITNVGLEILAEAFEKVPIFHFQFNTKRKEELAEGLELLKSVRQKNNQIYIDLNYI